MVKSYVDNLVRVQSSRVYDDEINPRDINTIEKIDIIKSKEEFKDKNTLNKQIATNEDVKVSLECSKEEISSTEKDTLIDELLKLKNLLDLKIIDEREFKLLKHKLISRI